MTETAQRIVTDGALEIAAAGGANSISVEQ
jgi:hypothetical protein